MLGIFFVDTNVLLDIATRDPKWFDWSSAQLAPLINARQRPPSTR